MKTILFILLSFLFPSGQNHQEMIKVRVEALPKHDLPYIRPRDYFIRNPYGFAKKAEPDLPIYAYRDIGGTVPTKYKADDVTLFQRFQVESDRYELVAWQMGISSSQRMLLITIDKTDFKYIDWLEVEISYICHDAIFGKEWTIDENGQIGVYQIKPLSLEPVLFYPEFNEFKGQRVDTFYKIDENGKFIQTRQIKYQPRIYTNAELRDVNKAIRLGNETVVQQ